MPIFAEAAGFVAGQGVHGHPGPQTAVSGGLTAVVVLLFPVAAGYALLRPFLPRPGRATTGTVATITAATVLWQAFLLPGGTSPWLLTTLAAGSALAPLALVRQVGRLAEPAAPWIFSIGAFVALVGFQQSWFGPLTPDRLRAVLPATIACALIALAWYPLCRSESRLLKWSAAVLAVALTGGVAQAVITAGSAGPKPGVPVLAGGVLLVPHRPGPNLVHVARPGVVIEPEHVTATPRPGTTGGWAVVRLPEGRSSLSVGGTEVQVDTGSATPAPDLTGPDGPECASALLGAHLVGKTSATCPADALSEQDASALRGVVGFLGGRNQPVITAVGDGSARSAAGERVVRDEAAARGVRVTSPADPAGPVVVVAGWAQAAATVDAVARGSLRAQGTYLAPWLLTPPLLTPPAGQVVPLAFPPSGESSLRYLTALAAAAPDEAPSAAGHLAWLSATGDTAGTEFRLHAASTVTAPSSSPHDHHGVSWLPGGTVTPISGPLRGG